MYVVMTDTSANLPTPLLKERHIEILPYTYYFDGKEYSCEDTEAFDGHVYYQAIRDGREVTTSQINPTIFGEKFESIVREGKDLLFVSMSSGISGSCQSAKLAALELQTRYPERQIEVVDTIGASLGEGIIALKAADMRDRGVPVCEAARQLREISETMLQVFTVDDLMHLRRMGRLSNFTAVLGSMLKLKPLLKGNEEGKIVSFAKYRGRRKALEALGRIYNDFVEFPEVQTVGIAHADCEEDAAYLAGLLTLGGKVPKDILTVCYEPVTGAHVGPDTLALFFLSHGGCRSEKLVSDIMDNLPSLPSLSSVKELKDKVSEKVGEKIPFRKDKE